MEQRAGSHTLFTLAEQNTLRSSTLVVSALVERQRFRLCGERAHGGGVARSLRSLRVMGASPVESKSRACVPACAHAYAPALNKMLFGKV